MTKFSKKHKTDAQIRKELEERAEARELDTEYEDWYENERIQNLLDINKSIKYRERYRRAIPGRKI